MAGRDVYTTLDEARRHNKQPKPLPVVRVHEKDVLMSLQDDSTQASIVQRLVQPANIKSQKLPTLQELNIDFDFDEPLFKLDDADANDDLPPPQDEDEPMLEE